MNWEHIKADWKDAKGKVKAKWGKLTDDDLTTIEGKWDQLVAKLQDRYGTKKDDAEREVDSFLKGMGDKNDAERKNPPPTRH